MQFIDKGTYYKIVFMVWSNRHKAMRPSGPGIYFPSWDAANTYMQDRVIVRHPDATIHPVVVE